MTPKNRNASLEDFQRRNDVWMAKRTSRKYLLAEGILEKEAKENTFRPQINKVS